MRKYIALLLCVVFAITANAQKGKLEAYRLYDNNGKEVSFDKMINKVSKSDIILFGELHNNPIAHWLQLRTTEGVFEKKEQLMLGAEMFEADDQLLLDEYLEGIIRKKDFEKYANLWDNYKTDYRPLVEFAEENNLRFVATNIPRRYASLIARSGYEGLQHISEEAKAYLPSLPIPFDTTVTSYVNMLDMDMGHGKGRDNLDIIKAQASKDATMAHRILKYQKKGVPFLHFQGDFHSANYSGIYWYLNHYKKDLKIATISTVSATDLDFKSSYTDSADYIIVVIEDMTTTY